MTHGKGIKDIEKKWDAFGKPFKDIQTRGMDMISSIETLTEAEQAVVACINKAGQNITEMNISDIASAAFVSISTVSRTIRKCGYGNLAEMRFKLSESNHEMESSNLINKVLATSYKECTTTIESIQIKSIFQIADYIKRAGKIFVVGRGLTSLVAQEFEFQLQCQRFPVWTISDSEMLKRMDRITRSGDLVIIFSVANSTPELAIAASLSKQNGANVVVCCCKKNTEIERLADVFVWGRSTPILPNKLYGSTSRLALHIISRTIIEYLFLEQ